MKVLIIGGGGREHALADKVSKSKLVEKIFIAPSNGVIEKKVSNTVAVSIKQDEIEKLLNFAIDENIDLTIVGPEAPLSLGIVNLFRKNHKKIVGPTKEASQLESSKAFSKDFMKKYAIPTARYEIFSDVLSACRFLEQNSENRWVVKVDELAFGKGVIVTQSTEEAKDAVKAFMERSILGFNAKKVIVEECLLGREISYFALCDGNGFITLGSAEDYKRLHDQDTGPNTGGMGAVSPAPALSDEDKIFIENEIIEKVIDGMNREKMPFSGVLFLGLMKTQNGISVLEFNTRFGDPETQVLLPLIESDLLPWLEASSNSSLEHLRKKEKLVHRKSVGVHVVMAAHGYPGIDGEVIRVGDSISFKKDFHNQDNEFLYFAGVKNNDGAILTNGGRVLGLTVVDTEVETCRKKIYKSLQNINFHGAHFRQDIGTRIGM